MTSLDTGRSLGVDMGLLTVLAPHRYVDLRLPLDVAVAGLLPELCDLLCTEVEQDEARPWVLTRAAGTALDPSDSLTAAGVRDGDTLHLLPVDALGSPPRLGDVVEEVVTSAGRPWTADLRRATYRSALAVVLIAGAAVSQFLSPAVSTGLVLPSLLAGAMATAAACWLARTGDVTTAHVLALAALPLWLLGGAHLSDDPSGDGTARLLLAGAALLCALLVQFAVLPSLRAVTGGLLIAAVPAEVALVVLHGAHGSGRLLAAVTALGLVSALPYAPKWAATVSGLTALTRPAEIRPAPHGRRPPAAESKSHDREAVARRVELARATLQTLLFVSVLGLGACWSGLLAAGPNGWSLALIALSAALLASRSTHHQQAGEVLTLTVGGLLGAVALLAGGLLVRDPSNATLARTSVLAAAALAALLLLALVLPALPSGAVTVRLVAKRAEILLRGLVVVVGVGATGVYGQVLDAAHSLGRGLHL